MRDLALIQMENLPLVQKITIDVVVIIQRQQRLQNLEHLASIRSRKVRLSELDLKI